MRAQEWSSNAEKTGAWARYTWASAQSVSEVVLYDRINLNDQILAATIKLSDGSTVAVPALANDPSGGPTIVKFASKSTTSITVTITAVSATTENVGLAEVAVY